MCPRGLEFGAGFAGAIDQTWAQMDVCLWEASVGW